MLLHWHSFKQLQQQLNYEGARTFIFIWMKWGKQKILLLNRHNVFCFSIGGELIVCMCCIHLNITHLYKIFCSCIYRSSLSFSLCIYIFMCIKPSMIVVVTLIIYWYFFFCFEPTLFSYVFVYLFHEHSNNVPHICIHILFLSFLILALFFLLIVRLIVISLFFLWWVNVFTAV